MFISLQVLYRKYLLSLSIFNADAEIASVRAKLAYPCVNNITRLFTDRTMEGHNLPIDTYK